MSTPTWRITSNAHDSWDPMVITHGTGDMLLNSATSFRQREAHDLAGHHPLQIPSVAPYCLRADFLDWHLSPTRIWLLPPSLPGTPTFHIICALSPSNLHTYVYAVPSRSNSFLQALHCQALNFKHIVAQLSLLNAFPYVSKKQSNAPSLFSYSLPLSMALIIFSFILWLFL